MGVYTMNATILRAMDHRPAPGARLLTPRKQYLICRRAASWRADAANVGQSTAAAGDCAMGKETGNMSILVIGGAGFIGRRMDPDPGGGGPRRHVRGHRSSPARRAAFARLGGKVKVVRGDVTQFDDVIGAVQESRAERLINLSYFIGELAPHVAFKLDVQGMDNCFEAARRCGVKHTVFASSVAVTGQQAHFGERLVDETDERQWRDPVCPQQNHQRVAGARLPPRLRHDDHLRAASQRDRPRQEVRLDRSRQLHVPAGARTVRHLPARRRHALRDPRRGHGGGIRARAASPTSPSTRPTTPAGPRSAWASWQLRCESSCRVPTSASRRRRAAARSRETS